MAIATAVAFVAATTAATAEAQVRLPFDNATPSKFFWASGGTIKFRFEIGGQQTRDMRVEVVQVKTGNVRNAWRINNVQPGNRVGVKWRAVLGNGNPAPQGNYRFRVREVGGDLATRTRPGKVRRSMVRHHRFPMRGSVSWGDGWGAGRGHRGQDLFAPCGRAILAARAGKVVWKDYQAGGAGHYVVIRGRKNNFDYVYMHLRPNIPVRQGDVVQTGQRIGSNGQTGNASGCHLHFELWRGKWFAGGRALPGVTRHLRKWHRWR